MISYSPATNQSTAVYQQNHQKEIHIPDEHLRAALEHALGKGEGVSITEVELANLTQLGASGELITELTGIEHCTNLEYLALNANSISDISPLASLTNLHELGLSGNSISDISVLSNLTNLAP